MKPTKASAEPVHHYTPEDMHNEDVAHEHVDVNISALVIDYKFMFGVVAGTAVLMLLLFNLFASQAAARDPKLSPLAMPSTAMPPTTTASPFFGAPEPKLMTDEPKRLNEVRTSEQSLLHAYGWTDEKAGVAHIPIDEAKKTDDRAGARGAAGSADRRAPRHTPAGEWRIFVGPQRHPHSWRPHARVSTGTRAGAGRARGPINSSGFRVQVRGSRVQGSSSGFRMSNRLLIAFVAALALAASTRTYAQTPGNLVEPGDPTSAGLAFSAESRSISESAIRCHLTFRLSTKPNETSRSATTSASVQWSWPSFTTSARCCALRRLAGLGARRVELRGGPGVRRRRGQLQPEGRALVWPHRRRPPTSNDTDGPSPPRAGISRPDRRPRSIGLTDAVGFRRIRREDRTVRPRRRD